MVPYIFAALALTGITYMVLSLFIGDALDFLDGLELDFALLGEGYHLGCAALAVFLATFGTVGWLSALSGSAWWINVLAGLAFGFLMARLAASGLGYVKAQEATDVASLDRLIGQMARATISTPAGKTGEAMIEQGSVMKFPVREMNNAPLQRGDMLEIVEVRGNQLVVKKVN